MSLPIIQHPMYTVILPISERKIHYRPFLTKEKKILLMAGESGKEEDIRRAMEQIVSNCTIPAEKIDAWNPIDLQYFFLMLRSKSVGESVDFQVTCKECKTATPYTLDFTKIKVPKVDRAKLNISIKDKIGVVMKFPDCSIESRIPAEGSAIEKREYIILNCIDYVYDENKLYYAKETPVEELKKFVENLPPEIHAKMENAIIEMPRIEYADTYNCKKCGKSSELKVDNLMDFFT